MQRGWGPSQVSQPRLHRAGWSRVCEEGEGTCSWGRGAGNNRDGDPHPGQCLGTQSAPIPVSLR